MPRRSAVADIGERIARHLRNPMNVPGPGGVKIEMHPGLGEKVKNFVHADGGTM
jgi:hypothetical protein